MKVLVTGPFGNLGKSTLEELISQGHQVRCFAVDRRANRKAAKRYKGKVEVVWGDIRRPGDVASAVQDQEAIIHLAFIIPSTISSRGISCEDHPDMAREVNVGGTANVIKAAKALARPPKFVFASSTDVLGITQDRQPPRTVADPVVATNHYSGHKIQCEELVKTSGLDWVMLRFCAVPPITLKLDPGGFDIPLSNRVEFVHTRDAGLACANALTCDEAIGKILLIGGGPRCQLYWGDFVGKACESLGAGMFPEKAYTTKPYRQDWVDTTESQRLLKYQLHTMDDYIEDMKREVGFKRHLIRAFRPIVRWYVLRQSPYYKSA